MFRAEPGTRPGVDADTRVPDALIGDKGRPDVSDETITNNMGVEYGLRQSDQFVVDVVATMPSYQADCTDSANALRACREKASTASESGYSARSNIASCRRTPC